MKTTVSLIIAATLLSACIWTRPSHVQKYAAIEGWQTAQYDGYRFFSCSKEDWYRTGFVATKNGQRITGTICSGLFFKGTTIRYD